MVLPAVAAATAKDPDPRLDCRLQGLQVAATATAAALAILPRAVLELELEATVVGLTHAIPG